MKVYLGQRVKRIYRYVLRLGLTSALTLLFACQAFAAVKLEVSVGFENTFRYDAWIPLTIKITGAPSTAAATLQVVVTNRDGTRVYSKPLRMQAGPAEDVHSISYYHPSPALMPAISVQLVSEGRKLAEKKVEQSLYVGDTQPVLVALTQDRGGFGYLHKLDLGFQHTSPESRGQFNPYGGGGRFPPQGAQTNNPTRVLYPGPSELPDSAFAYKWADAVILADLSLDTLTDPQWQALTQWVKDGGALIVSGGSDLNRFKAKQVDALLPIAPAGIRQLTALTALQDRYEEPVKVTSVPVVSGSLRADASPVCTQGDIPLLSYRRLGNGVVIFTAFDLLNSEIRAWPGQPAMWEEIMQVAQTDLKATDLFKSATSTSWNSSYRGLADALAGIQSTEAPSFTFIGLFLLAYIILLVPVNYLLLRKWDKKELAWVTAPVIILLFTTGAYAVGYSVKGGTLFLRYATVVEGAAGSDNWNAHTVASVFSPRQTRYNIAVDDPSALVGEVTLEPNAYQSVGSSDLTVERGRKTQVKDALISMWDNRNFSFDTHPDLGGVVNGSVIPSNNSYRVHVTNNTRQRLEDAMVSYGGVAVRVGELAPGEDWEGSIAVTPLGAATRIGPVLEGFSPSGSTAGRIKNALSSTIISNESSLPGNRPLIFSGWFTGTIQGLALENERPNVEGQNLLVVHLPLSNPSGASPQRRAARMPTGQNPFGGVPPPPTFGRMGPTTPSTNTMRAAQLNTQAYTFAGQGRLREALKVAYQAHAAAPNEAYILDTVAEMHQRLKEYSQAETYYKRALSRPGGAVAETYVKYGETLLALKRREEAIQQFQQGAMRDYGTWGAKARSHLTRLGVTAPTPGTSRVTGPTTTVTIPRGASIPQMPSTPGNGRRRVLQPHPNGGHRLIIQEWQNSPTGSARSQSEQYIPPGQAIPP